MRNLMFGGVATRFGGRRSASAVAAGAFLIAALAPVGGFAQDRAARPPRPGAQQQPPQDDTVTLGTDLVLLDVSVVDKGNRPVFDLKEDRFAVTEDGAPQQIKFFSKEEAAVSLGLVIDTSGSMRPKLETVVQAVTALVRANKPKDETAVIEFKDQTELLEEFTTDENGVEDALGDLFANGQSALLDAVLLGSQYVDKDAHNRRKALLVVTDGVEKGSYFTYDQVADKLKELDVRLYLVGFTQDLDPESGLFRKSQKKNAEGLLNKLAEDTGGRAFFPKDVSELGAISDQIANDLRTVYAIGYYPTNDKRDGTYRKVAVKVSGDGKLAARTRAGYYAEKQ